MDEKQKRKSDKRRFVEDGKGLVIVHADGSREVIGEESDAAAGGKDRTSGA